MNKRLESVGTQHVYALIIGVAYVLLQGILYGLALFLSRLIGTSSLAFCPKIPIIDDVFPVIPVFILIYLASFAFWSIGIAAVSFTGRKRFINYLIGLTLANYLTFLILLALPTYMDRAAEGLTQYASRPDILSRILTFVYRIDGSEYGHNLLPSYHCMTSVYCYLGVRKRPEIHRGYRIFTLIMSLLVCLSTLFTKQHYIIDSVSGICVAILSYAVVFTADPGEAILQKCASKNKPSEN